MCYKIPVTSAYWASNNAILALAAIFSASVIFFEATVNYCRALIKSIVANAYFCID
jgi:hypothetical protein